MSSALEPVLNRSRCSLAFSFASQRSSRASKRLQNARFFAWGLLRELAPSGARSAGIKQRALRALVLARLALCGLKPSRHRSLAAFRRSRTFSTCLCSCLCHELALCAARFCVLSSAGTASQRLRLKCQTRSWRTTCHVSLRATLFALAPALALHRFAPSLVVLRTPAHARAALRFVASASPATAGCRCAPG